MFSMFKLFYTDYDRADLDHAGAYVQLCMGFLGQAMLQIQSSSSSLFFVGGCEVDECNDMIDRTS